MVGRFRPDPTDVDQNRKTLRKWAKVGQKRPQFGRSTIVFRNWPGCGGKFYQQLAPIGQDGLCTTANMTTQRLHARLETTPGGRSSRAPPWHREVCRTAGGRIFPHLRAACRCRCTQVIAVSPGDRGGLFRDLPRCRTRIRHDVVQSRFRHERRSRRPRWPTFGRNRANTHRHQNNVGRQRANFGRVRCRPIAKAMLTGDELGPNHRDGNTRGDRNNNSGPPDRD